MKCNNCGNEVDGEFCTNCGTRATSNVTNKTNKYAKLLIEESEEVIAVLGNNIAQTFISTGVIGKGFSLLSNKRLYIKGKCLVRKGKAVFSKNEEKTVDLNDITGTGFIYNKAVWAKIVAIICGGMTVPMLLNVLLGHLFLMTPFSIYLILGIIFFAIYKTFNYSAFEISYAGGNIAFDLHWITEGEAKEFQRQVVIMKQNAKADENADGKQNVQDDVPKRLQEYKNLLDNGVINQEEFDAKKKQLLGL